MEIQLLRVVALDSSKQCSKEHNKIPNELKPDSQPSEESRNCSGSNSKSSVGVQITHKCSPPVSRCSEVVGNVVIVHPPFTFLHKSLLLFVSPDAGGSIYRFLEVGVNGRATHRNQPFQLPRCCYIETLQGSTGVCNKQTNNLPINQPTNKHTKYKSIKSPQWLHICRLITFTTI